MRSSFSRGTNEYEGVDDEGLYGGNDKAYDELDDRDGARALLASIHECLRALAKSGLVLASSEELQASADGGGGNKKRCCGHWLSFAHFVRTVLSPDAAVGLQSSHVARHAERGSSAGPICLAEAFSDSPFTMLVRVNLPMTTREITRGRIKQDLPTNVKIVPVAGQSARYERG